MIFDFKDYPEGSEKIKALLNKFDSLKKEQIIIFFLQTDKTFNRERVEELLKTLSDYGDIVIKNDVVKLKNKEVNESSIDAFWVFLHYANKNAEFDKADYPSEIVFNLDGEINEIIIMDDNALEKMDYLSKRKNRLNSCRYNFLFTSGTIDEFDDELFDIPVTLITLTNDNKDIPKLRYHEVNNV